MKFHGKDVVPPHPTREKKEKEKIEVVLLYLGVA